MGGLWCSSERSLLSLHVWGAGRSTNIPELRFGTARIHFGHRFSWPGCSSEKSDLAPVIPNCPSSPHTQPQGLLSWIQSPAEPLGLLRSFQKAEGSWRVLLVPSQPGYSGSSWGSGTGSWWDVTAGVGRLCPCAQGSPWHWAPSCHCNHPMEVFPSAFPLPDLAQREGEWGSGKNSTF